MITKVKIKPLTEAERTDWLNDLDDIEECAEAGVALGRALNDIKKRKLFREDYRSWAAFIAGCPQLRSMSRSRSYQLMEAAKTVQELSTIVDSSDLNEWELRCLKAIDSLPDRAEVKKRIREARLPVNEQNVERYYRELRDQEEAKAKDRAELTVLMEAKEEPAEQTPEEETSAEKRLKKRKKEFEKEVLYAARGCDHHRLGNKDWNKARKDELRDPELRRRARDIIAATRKACDRLTAWIDEWDTEVSALSSRVDRS